MIMCSPSWVRASTPRDPDGRAVPGGRWTGRGLSRGCGRLRRRRGTRPETTSTAPAFGSPDRGRAGMGCSALVLPLEVSVHRSVAVLALVVAGLAVAPPAHAVPTCGGKAATMVFGGGDDVVTGTPGDDVVVLGGGDDTYDDGALGHDTVCAGSGSDRVYALSPDG